MDTHEPLLADLREHYNDPEWMERHGADLFTQLEAGLKTGGDTANQAMRDLLLVYPYVFDREDLKQWTRLLEFAIRKYVPAPDTSRDLKRPEYVIHSPYTVRRLDHTPPIQTRTKRRRRVRTNPRELYEGYLILSTALFFRGGMAFDEDELNQFLMFTRRVNNQYVYHKAYQTLAYILVEQEKFLHALNVGRIAYRYFKQGDNVLETALTAVAIARIYARGHNDLPEALSWMRTGADLLSKSSFRRQYGLVAMELGCMLLHAENYQDAADWFDLANREFEVLADRHYMEVLRHQLSMAWVHTGRLDEAHAQCAESKDYWRKMGNRPQEIHAEYTLAYITARMGNNEQALGLLRTNLERLDDMPDDAWRAERAARTQALIDQIRDGVLLDSAKPRC